jgi:hypothetical protein
VFSLVLTVLDAIVLAAVERARLHAIWRALARSPAPHLVNGLAGLMMAVLWRSPFGPLAALLVLLPMYISGWVFAQYHSERAAHRATIRALVQGCPPDRGAGRGRGGRGEPG